MVVALASATLSATAGAVAATTVAASAQAAPPDIEALKSRLLEAAGGRGRLAEHAGTGLVRFFGTEPGQPVGRAQSIPAGTSPEVSARSFLATYGRLFGTDDPADLRLRRTAEADQGRSNVRFQQLHRGVPVLGGELVVNLDHDGNVLSANGELTPEPALSVEPAITAAEAAAQALSAIAKQRDVDRRLLVAATPALWVYDPVLLGGPDRSGPRLVWRTEITSDGDEDVRELVLVDATTGGIALHVDQIAHARTRRICDRNNVRNESSCVAPYTRSEGGAATGIAEVDNVYTYSGNVYDYFFNNFGRDSLNGAGMPLVSTVRYCTLDLADSCPFNNASWNGSQTEFGQGYVADDIVGHEFAHGVTQFESNLVYFYQSGAINESLSDVFGELIDLGNGLGNDTPGVRWRIAEDRPGGAFRNMADPPAFGDPDSMTSPNYWVSDLDNGGVHTNSGVNNKAAFLMVDGGTFNGVTVTGIGTAKAGHIYYEANANLLTFASDYLDLFYALKQACLNKVGTAGITAADCTEVEKAATATRMNVPAPNPTVAPVCPAGSSPNTLFFDDMENDIGNWLFDGSGSDLVNGQWRSSTLNPASGFRSLYARNVSTASDRYAYRANPVVPPSGETTYLRFNHWFDIEENYDGGVVEYSTNGGSSWSDAGPLFIDNGYNRPNSAGPLAGRQVFGDGSNGYQSSRLNLSTLAGQNVLYRFRLASDTSVGFRGWFVDDVRVYTCGTAGTPPAITSANNTTFTVGSPGSFTVTATGSPAPTLSMTGALPSGVTFNAGTGVLSGTPAAGTAATYSLTFTASNGVPPNASQSFTLTVLAAGADFTPLAPARILDTRTTVGSHPAKLVPGETANVVVTGVGGVPASGVDSVVLNVTATGGTAATYLTVFPAGQPRPTASNLNVVPNQDIPNLVVAKVGTNGQVAVYNNQGMIDVIFDVVGWYRPVPACFTSLTPARILDTRSTTKVGPGETRGVLVTGVGGVPSTGVGAVVVNVTATGATAATFLTVFPTGQARPNASNLNVVANQDVPNLVVAKVGTNGNVSVYNNQGSVDVIFDVVGWHPVGAACFTSLTPARILDTRSAGGPLGPGQSRNVIVTGVGGVPLTGVAAVVLNVTATDATAATYLTVFPAGQPRPDASNLNVVPNRDIPNLVVAKVGANGNVTVYNNQGSTHVIFDVVGFYSA